MTYRITQRHLEAVRDRINTLAGTPAVPYKRIDGRNVAQVGCYVLDGAYGGWKLAQIVNDMGGQRDITHGYDSKRVLLGKMEAFIEGLRVAK